ncbi:hypothetical protein EMIT048CA2_90101 [Pseudomonas chlororaphis]
MEIENRIKPLSLKCRINQNNQISEAFYISLIA